MLRVCLVLFVLPLMLMCGEPEAQREIHTRQDFNDLEKTLLATRMIDAGKADYYLGLLYMSDHTLDDGSTIKADDNRALEYFGKSLEENNHIAAYTMSMIFLRQGNVNNAIFVLDQTLRSLTPETQKDISSGAYLAAALASLVLDYKSNDSEALSLAIEYLSLYTEKKPTATGNYLLSQLYLRTKDSSSANRHLTLACTSQNIPKEISQICENMRSNTGGHP